MRAISESIHPSILSGEPIALAAYESGITIDDTFSSKTKNIDTLKRIDGGIQTVVTAITFLINRADKVNAIYDEIPEDLSVSLAVDIMEVMAFEKVDDVLLMFKMARQGKLNLDVFAKKKSFYETVLQEWMPAYLDLKAQAREKKITASRFDDGEGAKENFKAIARMEGFKKLMSNFDNNAKKKSLASTSKEFIKNKRLVGEDAVIASIKKALTGKTYDQIKEYREIWANKKDTAQYLYVFDNELKLKQ